MKKLFGALLVAALMASPLTAMAGNADDGVYHINPSVVGQGQCAQYGAVWDGTTCKFDQNACSTVNGSWVQVKDGSDNMLYYCSTADFCNNVTAANQANTQLPEGTTARFDTNTGKCVYDNLIYTYGDHTHHYIEGFIYSDANCSEYGGTEADYTMAWNSNMYHSIILQSTAKRCFVSGTLNSNSGNAHIDTSLVNDSSQCAQYGAVWNSQYSWCEFNEDACTSAQGAWRSEGSYYCDTAAFCNLMSVSVGTLRFDTSTKKCVLDNAMAFEGAQDFRSVGNFTYSDTNCRNYNADGYYGLPGAGVIGLYNGNYTGSRFWCTAHRSSTTSGEAYIDPTIVNSSGNCAQYGAVWDSENSRCKFDQTACTTAGGRWWTNASGQGVCMTQASCRSPYRWDSTNKLCVVDGSIKDHGTGTFNTVNGFTYSSENCLAYTTGTGTTNQTIQSGAVVNPSEPAVLTYCEVDDGSSASSPFRVSRLTPTEADGTLIASGAYAKGAYNANVGNINNALTYVEDSSVETINHATVSAENVNLSVAGFTPAGTIDVDSSNATVSGTVNVANTVTMFSQWGTTSTENGTLSGSMQASIANGAVTGMTGTFSGPASGQLSGTGTLSNASVHVNNWVPVNPS